MAARTITKPLSKVTPDEYRQLYSLNLRNDGCMQSDLVQQKRCEPDTTDVIMVKDSGRILSWALVFPKDSYKKDRTVYFYTRKNERRKGYGKRLVRAAKKLDPQPRVIPHDNRSGAFFKQFEGSLKWDRYNDFWCK